MNWKLYAHDNALKFAEEDDEGDEPDDENPGGGNESDEESDIDKLRSSYDSKLAELNRKLEDLQSKSAEPGVDWNKEYGTAKQEIDGYLAAMNQEKDPAKALEYAKGALAWIAPKYGSFAADRAQFSSMYKTAEAERYAFMLKAEVGGDTNSYKAKLLQAKNIDEMTLKFERMQFDLAKEKKPKNRESQSGNRIDRGGGGASRTNVLKEMEDIDLSTPEGRQKWQEKRPNFRKKLESTPR